MVFWGCRDVCRPRRTTRVARYRRHRPSHSPETRPVLDPPNRMHPIAPESNAWIPSRACSLPHVFCREAEPPAQTQEAYQSSGDAHRGIAQGAAPACARRAREATQSACKQRLVYKTLRPSTGQVHARTGAPGGNTTEPVQVLRRAIYPVTDTRIGYVTPHRRAGLRRDGIRRWPAIARRAGGAIHLFRHRSALRSSAG